MLLADGMKKDEDFLDDAEFRDHLFEEMSVDVVVEILDGDFDLGRLPDKVLVDLELGHVEFHGLETSPKRRVETRGQFVLPRVRWRRRHVVRVAGDDEAVVADHSRRAAMNRRVHQHLEGVPFRRRRVLMLMRLMRRPGVGVALAVGVAVMRVAVVHVIVVFGAKVDFIAGNTKDEAEKGARVERFLPCCSNERERKGKIEGVERRDVAARTAETKNDDDENRRKTRPQQNGHVA